MIPKEKESGVDFDPIHHRGARYSQADDDGGDDGDYVGVGGGYGAEKM